MKQFTAGQWAIRAQNRPMPKFRAPALTVGRVYKVLWVKPGHGVIKITNDRGETRLYSSADFNPAPAPNE